MHVASRMQPELDEHARQVAGVPEFLGELFHRPGQIETGLLALVKQSHAGLAPSRVELYLVHDFARHAGFVVAAPPISLGHMAYDCKRRGEKHRLDPLAIGSAASLPTRIQEPIRTRFGLPRQFRLSGIRASCVQTQPMTLVFFSLFPHIFFRAYFTQFSAPTLNCWQLAIGRR